MVRLFFKEYDCCLVFLFICKERKGPGGIGLFKRRPDDPAHAKPPDHAASLRLSRRPAEPPEPVPQLPLGASLDGLVDGRLVEAP